MRSASLIIPLSGAFTAISVFCFQPVFGQSAITIDHNCTDLSQVPAAWITQAKSLFKASYGHTSHGSQVISGMDVIKNPPGSLYWWDYSGTQSGLSLWDYTPSGDLGAPDYTTWATLTREMLNGYGADRNLVLWSWCGQADTSPENIQIYLGLMAAFRADYPSVTFVHMTGHLVGTGTEGNLNQRNNQIRAVSRRAAASCLISPTSKATTPPASTCSSITPTTTAIIGSAASSTTGPPNGAPPTRAHVRAARAPIRSR